MTFEEANRRRWQRDLEEPRERVKRIETEQESSGPMVKQQLVDNADQELRRHKATIKTLEASRRRRTSSPAAFYHPQNHMRAHEVVPRWPEVAFAVEH